MAALALPAPITIGLALRWLQPGDVGREAGRGAGGGERGVEQVAQQRAGVGIFHLRASSHYRGAMQPLLGPGDPPPFSIYNEAGKAPLLLLCDHASKAVPKALGDLGITDEELSRHIGWDIGGLDAAIELVEDPRRAAGRLGLFAAGDRLQSLAGRRGLDAGGQRQHRRAGQQGPDKGAGRRARRGLLLAVSPRSRPPARSHDGRRPRGSACW